MPYHTPAMLPIKQDRLLQLALSLCKVSLPVIIINVLFLCFAVATTIYSSFDLYTANETAPVTFQCTSTGVPTPSITWYRNGSALTPSSDPRVSVGSPIQQLLSSGLYQVTQTLTITNTTATDSWNYSCAGTNIAGTNNDGFRLVVQCEASIHSLFQASCNVLK